MFQGTSKSSGAGESYIKTAGPEPLSLDDVKIRRVVLDKTILEIEPIIIDDLIRSESRIDFPFNNGQHLLITEELSTSKTNMGRRLSILFDSDNVDYCSSYARDLMTTPCDDGYADGYAEGYCDDVDLEVYYPRNIIVVYGETVDGPDSEEFFIDRNGEFVGEKFFTSVSHIETSMVVADPDYFELGVLSIMEADDVTVQNNNGSYASIDAFYNGTFMISEFGSEGTFPFELPPGKYTIDYPAYLKVFLPSIGEKLFVGSDMHGKNQLCGVIDEIRIISEMSGDTRHTERSTSSTRSITNDFNRPVPFCLDEQTLSLIHFDNPIDLQSRKLRVKEFLNADTNFKFKIPYEQREVLVKYVNDKENFISKMLYFGYSEEDAERTFYEVHKAEGGPIFNNGTYLDKYDQVPLSSTSVNDTFGKSGVFDNGNAIIYENDEGMFRKDEGTIEFWISPLLDVKNDLEERYFVDIYSIERKRVLSESASKITLPSAASKIVSIKLLNKTREFSEFFSKKEVDNIIFDDLHVSKTTGRVSGGTGVEKDFSYGSSLSPNGKEVTLTEPLPSFNTDVIVTYIPSGSSGDRLSIFKDSENELVFRIFANGQENIVNKTVDWRRNSWHRVTCMYKANSSSDFMSIIIDDEQGDILRFGEGGAAFGDGMTIGQIASKDGNVAVQEFNIRLSDSFRLVSVGASVFGNKSGKCRMDNIRFSRLIRKPYYDSSGMPTDPNYSSNLNTVSKVAYDDATTKVINFDNEVDMTDRFAKLIDPKHGIFDFDLEIIDDLERVVGINDGEIEDLITELANRLKPAHSNVLVKFFNKHC